MEAKQFEGKTLQYLAIEPDGYDATLRYPMIILLHGYGASMRDLAGLCPAINSEGYIYICPNAPITVEIGNGMNGYAWTPPRDEREAEDIELSVEKLSVLVEEVTRAYKTEAGRIVLGGFSQGGMMTYRYGLTSPDLFKGLVILSGLAPDMDLLREMLPEDRSQAVFVAHGTSDHMIGITDARSSHSFLESEGYTSVYKEYGMGHEISQDVLDDLVPWIHEVLPPAV
ncbi:MAG: alpha/beta fold hydrolase [Chloroflexi bacterium]|nr:alpha/beta fold hydrolase [Chloroflexota bacterium]MDA1226449.1 alpha/beta fold hydrolase [Chloroflexota bacterium]